MKARRAVDGEAGHRDGTMSVEKSDKPKEETGIVLTKAQQRSRRARNLAIGVAVALFIALIYFVTIVKLGHMAARPPV